MERREGVEVGSRVERGSGGRVESRGSRQRRLGRGSREGAMRVEGPERRVEGGSRGRRVGKS
eukprot:1917691-Rhodomonas_salina.1